MSCTQGFDQFNTSHTNEEFSMEFQLPMQSNVATDTEVSEVRILAFNAKTGECFKNELLTFNGNKNPSITVEGQRAKADVVTLEKGTYDLLFIANESSTMVDSAFKNKLRRIGNISEISTAPFSIQSYKNGLTDRVVMSAFYPNVVLASPNNSSEKTVHKIVHLVRSFAKVEVVFENHKAEATFKRIKKVQLLNVPSKYNIPALATSFFKLYGQNSQTVLTIEDPFKEEDYQNITKPIGKVSFYIPEFLRYKDDSDINRVALHVEGVGFFDLNQDLIDTQLTETRQPRFPVNYNELSNYSAIRNVIYRYTVKLTKRSELEAVLEILPWTLIDSEKNFTKPEWDTSLFKVSVGGKDYTKQQEVPLRTGQEAIITFKLNEPEGAEWKASLTNGRDFKFTSQSAGGNGKVYQIKVKAANEWSGTLKFTEFLMAIEGEELPIWESAIGINNGEGGVGKRYVFKQIE